MLEKKAIKEILQSAYQKLSPKVYAILENTFKKTEILLSKEKGNKSNDKEKKSNDFVFFVQKPSNHKGQLDLPLNNDNKNCPLPTLKIKNSYNKTLQSKPLKIKANDPGHIKDLDTFGFQQTA